MSSDRQMETLIAHQALEWFVAHRANELTDAQREDFIDWLRASPLHAREYLALSGFAEDVRQIAKGFSASTDSLIAQAQAADVTGGDKGSVRHLFGDVQGAVSRSEASHASADGEAAYATPHYHRPRRARTLGIAAVLAFATFVLGTLAVWLVHSRADYSTAHAEQRSWRMPDGSTVHLNSGSKIEVSFDERRRVVELLQGQALFQVAKDERRPFLVRAGETTVRAVGTEFDVYRQARQTLVSVVEGRVAISHGETQTAGVQLDAGEQATVSRESTMVAKKSEAVRKTVAWLQRQVVFDHDPLTVAVDEFNRYSTVRIHIEDASLRDAEVSGIFSAYDAEAFIRFLEHQPDMRVERSATEVRVTAIAPLSP
jgi:transmembrane sensor